MEVEQLAIPKRKAEEEYQALRQAFKQNTKLRREEIRQDLKKVYGHLRHGKKIVDIYETFSKVGINENRNPRLAICRADAKTCYCHKQNNGEAIFSVDRGVTVARKSKLDVWLPEGTFKFLDDPQKSTSDPHWMSWGNRDIKTLVPIIPTKILVKEVKVLLRNFHILWEVELGAWKISRPPRDPILLRQLTPNLYGVLATWNLTKLERAVIRGRIG